MKVLLRTWLILLGLVAGTVGCTLHRMPPWNLEAPGWSSHEAAAVWRPRQGAPELTGELLIVNHIDGARLVQFSKQGIPLVVTRVDRQGWDIRSPMQSSVHSGKGRPPAGVLWFLVDEFPPSRPAHSAWSLRLLDDAWILENKAKGEFLEVRP